jgi:hypothetical protein
MNRRLAVAGQAVVDEPLVAEIARFEESPMAERHKAALRYADAHMTFPTAIDDALRRQLHEHFAPAELLELMLDVSAWSRQKVAVALGKADPPPAVTLLTFDAAGYSTTP